MALAKNAKEKEENSDKNFAPSRDLFKNSYIVDEIRSSIS
jgi:CTP:phosphocholine cytidylyltransferase-like protein